MCNCLFLSEIHGEIFVGEFKGDMLFETPYSVYS